MQSAPPPGWYPDPAESQTLRWWDGAQWGPTAPTASDPGGVLSADHAEPFPAPTPTGAPTWLTWIIGVGTEIVALLGALLAVAVFGPSHEADKYLAFGVLIAFAVGFSFVMRDVRNLRAAGLTFPAAMSLWYLFGGAVYLAARTASRPNRGKGDWAVLATSLVTTMACLAAAVPVITSVIPPHSALKLAAASSWPKNSSALVPPTKTPVPASTRPSVASTATPTPSASASTPSPSDAVSSPSESGTALAPPPSSPDSTAPVTQVSGAAGQVEQDGYSLTGQTVTNGYPIALGQNTAGNEELVETWPSNLVAQEEAAQYNNVSVMYGIEGVSCATNGSLLIVDAPANSMQFILNNSGYGSL
jgi:hypothetical protein